MDHIRHGHGHRPSHTHTELLVSCLPLAVATGHHRTCPGYPRGVPTWLTSSAG